MIMWSNVVIRSCAPFFLFIVNLSCIKMLLETRIVILHLLCMWLIWPWSLFVMNERSETQLHEYQWWYWIYIRWAMKYFCSPKNSLLKYHKTWNPFAISNCFEIWYIYSIYQSSTMSDYEFMGKMQYKVFFHK